MNAEFQRIARGDKKYFLNDQCKEIEGNNRMGMTRDLCWEPAQEIPPMTRSCGRDLISKASGLEGLPGPIPPMTRSCGEI